VLVLVILEAVELGKLALVQDTQSKPGKAALLPLDALALPGQRCGKILRLHRPRMSRLRSGLIMVAIGHNDDCDRGGSWSRSSVIAVAIGADPRLAQDDRA
jgi:hypothetical protein